MEFSSPPWSYIWDAQGLRPLGPGHVKNRRYCCLWLKTVRVHETAPDTSCRQRLRSLAAAAAISVVVELRETSEDDLRSARAARGRRMR